MDIPSTSKSKQDENLEDNCDSDSNESDGTSEKCPICLLALSNGQEVGRPAVCDHIFCFPCISEWSSMVQTCPIDRAAFSTIRVYTDPESEKVLRTVRVEAKKQEDEEIIELIGIEEFTPCEICSRFDHEDRMLLCDGCDKGFHMDCLDPPLLEIPSDEWFCDDCYESSSEDSEDEGELEDLTNDIEGTIGQLPPTRLRTRQQQPQILRTLQSERIRSAILARMTLRSARTATEHATLAAVPSRVAAPQKRRIVARRKPRRRTRQVVVEYGVDSSDKFAMRTRRVTVKSRRKKRKKKVSRRSAVRRGSTRLPTATATSFKFANPNVHELQHGRMLAGVNFNIFQPTNELDYVPDEDQIEDSGIEEGGAMGGVLTQAIANYTNPLRRNMLIKKRVLQNCTTTSNQPNLLDSIMQDQALFGPGSICQKFAVDKSSGRLLLVGKGAGDAAKQASGGEGDRARNGEENGRSQNSGAASSHLEVTPDAPRTSDETIKASRSFNDPNDSQTAQDTSSITNTSPDKKKKPKKAKIDMFDENSASSFSNDCPNFSIYDAVDDAEASSSYQMRPEKYVEENVDLVQMSDNEQPHEFSGSSLDAPPEKAARRNTDDSRSAIEISQPASPDPITDPIPDRSYTPPLLVEHLRDDSYGRDKRNKEKKDRDRDRELKKSRKRELERYNVRDRQKERSPLRLRDKFGRNRSRTRSSSRRRHSRRRSRSVSRDRRRRSRSRNRSCSRRRTPSVVFERKRKVRKPARRSRSRSLPSRSLTPKHRRPATPREERRVRSKSKKTKKKKNRERSREKPSTLTKEVFASGSNILVSVNFNNTEEKQPPKRRRSPAETEEPKDVVDITAKKKITVCSKPVAIIDLARSPFRELTPEYQSNVIELSDSEGEKHREKLPPKSPDSSSKLYDPFEILNSPSNENVTSSQNTPMTPTKPPKVIEPVKPILTFNKTNLLGITSLSGFFNEENQVTSSSSMFFNDKTQAIPLLGLKAAEPPIEKAKVIAEAPVTSPYSPGHDYEDSFEQTEEELTRPTKNANIFDELFGSSTPPALDRLKSSSKGGAGIEKPTMDPSDKYLNKLKRQERVIEEVKLVIKPYYSRRTINKEQYKDILRRAVPKICHSREINPQKIKHLIDSYVKIFRHRSKRVVADLDESF